MTIFSTILDWVWGHPVPIGVGTTSCVPTPMPSL